MTSKILDLIYIFKSNALRNYSILWCAYNPRFDHIQNKKIARNIQVNEVNIWSSIRKIYNIWKRMCDMLCAYLCIHIYWAFCWFLWNNSRKKMEGKPLSSSIVNDMNLFSFLFSTIPLQMIILYAVCVCALYCYNTLNSCMKLTHFDSKIVLIRFWNRHALW